MEPVESPAIRRRADLIAAALILALVSIWFADVVFFGRNFFLRDVTRYYYPMKQILRRVVSAGEFPFWNRAVGAGQPLAANPEFEIFYPPTWLLCALPYYTAFRVLILGHVVAGLLGTYALLRGWKCRPVTAFYGAAAFGLGGGLLSLTNLWEHLTSAAWVPLVLLAFDRLLTRRSFAAFGAAATVLGMQLLVCEPTIPLQSGILVIAWTLLRPADAENRMRMVFRDIRLVVLACAVALAVATPAWLAAIDLARDGVRGSGLGAAMSMSWSTPPIRLAELVYPNIMGHIGPILAANYWGRSFYPGHYSPFLLGVYGGLLTAMCAAAGLLLRRERWAVAAAVIGICLFFALGNRLAPAGWLWRSPLFGWLRYPEKFIFSITFVIAVFGALMVERILAGDETLRRWSIGLTAGAAGVAAVLAMRTSLTQDSVAAFARFWEIPSNFANLGYMAAVAHHDWIVAAGRGLAIVIALAVLPRLGRAGGPAMVALLLADLAIPSREITPTMPERFFELPPVASALRDIPGSYRLYHAADYSSGGPDREAYFSLSTPTAWIYRNGLYPEWPVAAGIESALDVDASKTNLLPTVTFDHAFRQVLAAGSLEAAEAMLAMSNVWFRGVLRPAGAELRRHPRIEELRPVGFIAGPRYPRYYFAARVVHVSDEADFIRQVSADPRLAIRTAFVRGEGFDPAAGRIGAVRETPNGAELLAESLGEGFLVISVTPHKYWRFTVDGRPVQAVSTNIGYQGLRLGPGSHTIAMMYRNPLVAIGSSISLLSLAVIFAGAAMERARNRRQGRTT